MDKSLLVRLDNIEEILKMLLINSVIEAENEKLQENILNSVREYAATKGLTNLRINQIEKRCYLFAELVDCETLNEIKKRYFEVSEKLGENLRLVLVYETIHSRRKKAFEDAGISFYLTSGELKVY